MSRTRSCTPAVWIPPQTWNRNAKCVESAARHPDSAEKYDLPASQVTDYKRFRWWAV